MTKKYVDEKDYQKLYEFLLTDQLDHCQAVQFVNRRPEFKQWLKEYFDKKYGSEYNADNNINS